MSVSGLRRICLGHVVSEPGYWSATLISYDLDRGEVEVIDALRALQRLGLVQKRGHMLNTLVATTRGYYVLDQANRGQGRAPPLTFEEPTRTRVLKRVVESEGETAIRLAEVLGIARTTVDSHLWALRMDGLVFAVPVKSTKGGRPAFTWYAVPSEAGYNGLGGTDDTADAPDGTGNGEPEE